MFDQIHTLKLFKVFEAQLQQQLFILLKDAKFDILGWMD